MTTIDAIRERIRRATEAAQNMRDREVDAELKAQARGQADAYYVIMNMVKDITPEEVAPSAMRQLGATLRRLRNELQYTYEYEYTLEGMERIARWSIEWVSDIIIHYGGEAVLLPVRPEAVPEQVTPRPRDARGRFVSNTTPTWAFRFLPAPADLWGYQELEGYRSPPQADCSCSECATYRASNPMGMNMHHGTAWLARNEVPS